MDISWHQVASSFESDGSLRDVYVHSAEVSDWNAVLDLLRGEYAPLAFSRDGLAEPMPARVEDIFAQTADATIALDFEVAGIELACHFFTPTEIEFDLPPEQVNSSAQFQALLAFLRRLAATVRKPVILAQENAPDLPILTVDRAGQATLHEEPDAPAI
jgi:hypothetical protein